MGTTTFNSLIGMTLCLGELLQMLWKCHASLRCMANNQATKRKYRNVTNTNIKPEL